MCGICGCNDVVHEKPEGYQHEPGDKMLLPPHIAEKNKAHADINRAFFQEKNILAINVFSTPSSGKTALLTETVNYLQSNVPTMVIVGDQETHVDKEKIKASGAHVVQISPNKTCHLDAHEVGSFIKQCQPSNNAVLFIENAGNLVCPALFDLGEKYRIVILSVTENDNKPLKFPEMFRHADLLLITKTDLLPFNHFNPAKCIENARMINPDLTVIQISTVNGQGVSEWCEWLAEKYKQTAPLKIVS